MHVGASIKKAATALQCVDEARALRAALAVLAILATSAPLPLPASGTQAAGPLPPSPAGSFSAADGGAVVLSRVYANAARDDEFVEIADGRGELVDVGGWSLTDGEATATFPSDSFLPADGRLLVTRNSTSYAEDSLATADFTFEQGTARRMEGGILRLADDGDEVRLVDASGRIVDAYLWGDASDAGGGWLGRPADAMGRGEIAVRSQTNVGAWIDSDGAGDWEGLRRHRLGQSSFAPSEFQLGGGLTPVLSPDGGDGPLRSFIESAQETLDIAVYTFTSAGIASTVASLADRGVRVRVLLDGAPVGGVEPEEDRVVRGLLDAGAEVRWLAGAGDVVKRYRYLHAKYAIVDGRAVWIGSENFGNAGFPSEDHGGNRGWSVVVADAAVAAALTDVFEVDFNPSRRDSMAAMPEEGDPLPPAQPCPPWPSFAASTIRRARLVIAPDTSLDPDGLLEILASASNHIWIEAFYVDETWRDRPNPFLEAAFDAARRGVSVRLLLDGSWSSVGDDSAGNDAVVEHLNRRAWNESLDFAARLLEPRGRIERLHNKGVVVDGRAVLVSSMNWALGSATENREVGIILEDPDTAGFFEAAFAADWDGRPTSGFDAWRLEDPVLLLGVYAFVGVASVVSLRKLRVGAKGIKPRVGVRRRGASRADLRGRRGEVRLLPSELVAQSRARTGGRRRARRGREEARGRVRRPEGD